MTLNDKHILIEIVKEMTDAQTAAQIMKHWADDVIWFDITARFLKGYDAVYAEFDEQFNKLEKCGATIDYLDCQIGGDLGIVTTTQKFWAIYKGTGQKVEMITRQTDCFSRRDGVWKLTHQHISLPIADTLALFKAL